MIGHNKQKQFFKQIIDAEQLSHAYILSGPEGIGKKYFATELAKGLLCESNKLFGGCHCPSCKQVDSKTHPDFHMFDDREDLKIAGVRRIPEIVGSTAYSGKWKIVVLDNAHLLCAGGVDAAANALLKTLEEPGRDTVFFLITHRLERILSTIISRCIVVNFYSLSDDELRSVCTSQGIEVNEDLLRYAGGSVSNIAAIAGFDFQGLSDAMSKKDADGVALRILKINDKAVLQALLSILQIDLIRKFSKGSSGDLMHFIQYLKRIESELDYNVNLNVVILDLFVKLSDCLQLR